MGSSHFPIILQFYSLRTSLWMGENRENQTMMAKRSLQRRNAFSFYFNRIPHICNYGTGQEIGMEICRNSSCKGDQRLLDIQPYTKILMYIFLRDHTAFTVTVFFITLSLQYQFNQNFRKASSGPFSSPQKY